MIQQSSPASRLIPPVRLTAFANADLDTLGYIKGKLGNVPMLMSRSSGASSSALLSGARPTQDDLRDAALLETDELARALERGKRRILALAAGRQPLILERVLYYENAMFEGMFDRAARRHAPTGVEIGAKLTLLPDHSMGADH